MNGWTLERRTRQAQAMRHWRPWERSTGPRTVEGAARSARSADRGALWRREGQKFKEMWAALRTWDGEMLRLVPSAFAARLLRCRCGEARSPTRV